MNRRAALLMMVVAGVLGWVRTSPGAGTYDQSVEEAERLWSQGQKMEAVRLYADVWRQNPEDVERQILYGNRSADVKFYRWSLNFLKVAESKSKGNPDRLHRIYTGYARTYRMAGFPDSARMYEKKAAELKKPGGGQKRPSIARQWKKYYFGYYTRKSPSPPAGSRAALTRRGLLKKRILVEHATGTDLDPAAVSFANEVHKAVLREMDRTGRFLVVENDGRRGPAAKPPWTGESTIADLAGQKPPGCLWAQFLLRSALMSFERKPAPDRPGNRMVRAVMSIQVYDLETRSTIVSDTFTVERTFRGTDDQSRAGRTAIGALVRELEYKVADRTAAAVENPPWKTGIISVAGAEVSLNAGTHSGLRAGQRFEVVRPGETLTDPDTGEVLTIATEIIGLIETVRVGLDESGARIVEETESIRPCDQAVAW